MLASRVQSRVQRRWALLPVALLAVLACCVSVPTSLFLSPGRPGLGVSSSYHRGQISRIPRGRGGSDSEVLEKGNVVEAVFPDDGNWYSGVVEKVNTDGTYEVKWDNPDGGPEVSTCTDVKKYTPPIPLSELKVGDKYKGTIVSTAPFGAFVNIGAEKDGLVHVSCVKDGFVSNIDDEVQAGQEVTVWIKSVDDGKLGLTMVESKLTSSGRTARPKADLTKFQDLTWGEKLTGTVVSVTNFGAFVSVEPPGGGAAAQGLVHVSELSNDYVEDPFSIVKQGQEVTVYVKDVDLDAGRLSLSMKDRT